MNPYFIRKNIKIYNSDVFEGLSVIPNNTIHCCVTSPPYWGLRSYLPAGHDDKHREIGSEPTPDAYVETMVGVFREVRRVLHNSGTVWLNVGDSYTPVGTFNGGGSILAGRELDGHSEGSKFNKLAGSGLKPKDLCLIPWRLAIALQADGWWVRSIICWAKKSCMPESVTDRPTNSWEPIFLLSKRATYFYDAEAVKEPAVYGELRATFRGGGTYTNNNSFENSTKVKGDGEVRPRPETGTRNQRNFWHLGPEPFAEAHFATFPTEIPRRAILAGTSASGCCPKCRTPWVRKTESTKTFESGSGKAGNRPNGKQDLSGSETNSTPDIRMGPVVSTRTVGWETGCKCQERPVPCTVLDPFSGAGTTGLVAARLDRHYVGIELNKSYCDLSAKRISKELDQDKFDFSLYEPQDTNQSSQGN